MFISILSYVGWNIYHYIHRCNCLFRTNSCGHENFWCGYKIQLRLMVTSMFWGNPLLNVCEHPSQTVCAEGTEMCLVPVKEAVSNIECFWQTALKRLLTGMYVSKLTAGYLTLCRCVDIHNSMSGLPRLSSLGLTLVCSLHYSNGTRSSN